jgi:F0F1-type ATP synthase assembly protein I
MAFLTLGVTAAGSLVAGGLLGYLVDDWAGTSPLFTLVGLGVGIVAAVMMTVTRVRKYL